MPKILSALVAALLLAAIAVYRWLLSPVLFALGARCRFHPSCSTYAAACIRHYGPARGSWRALKRLGRCHPFHPGGYDPPLPLTGPAVPPSGGGGPRTSIHG